MTVGSVRVRRTPLVIGIGNEFRGDDAAGLIVVRRLSGHVNPPIRAVESGGDGALLVELWKDESCAFVVDAVRSGARPGSVFRFEAHREPLPQKLRLHSSHAFGVAEAVELSRSLGQLPSRLIVYGIEGEAFETGAEISASVRRSACDVVKQIIEEIQQRKNP